MELTFRHRQVLGTIGRFGATRERLGHLATSRELLELTEARFVSHEPTSTHRLDAWVPDTRGRSSPRAEPRRSS